MPYNISTSFGLISFDFSFDEPRSFYQQQRYMMYIHIQIINIMWATPSDFLSSRKRRKVGRSRAESNNIFIEDIENYDFQQLTTLTKQGNQVQPQHPQTEPIQKGIKNRETLVKFQFVSSEDEENLPHPNSSQEIEEQNGGHETALIESPHQIYFVDEPKPQMSCNKQEKLRIESILNENTFSLSQQWRKDFLMKQVERQVKMVITRHPLGLLNLHPLFHLHLVQETAEPIYLCSAKMTSSHNFVISDYMHSFETQETNYLGSVKGSFSGQTYNIFRPKQRPENMDQTKQKNLRSMVASVEYCGSFGCVGAFKAYTMNPGLSYWKHLVFAGNGQEEQPLSSLYKNHYNRSSMKAFQYHQFYSLDASHLKSKRNFQLYPSGSLESSQMLFAKSQLNKYDCTIKLSLSPFVGFAISLTTFASKIGL